MVVVIVVTTVLLWPRENPQPPEIMTRGLDLAVASLIQRTVREVRETPRSAAAWGRLASVLMHYEFIPEAKAVFARAEWLDRKDPRWPYLHSLLLLDRQPEAALSGLIRAVDLAGAQPDMPRIQLTRTLVERGEIPEAERHIEILLRARPDHPLALLESARLRLAAGQAGECVDLASRCQGNPHAAQAARTLLSQAYQRMGDPVAAERVVREKRELPADEPWPDPYWEEALVYRVGAKAMLQDASDWMDQGHVEEAVAVLFQVARDYPEEADAWYLMGWGLNRLERHIEAEGALREYLRRRAESAKGLAQTGVALIGQERHEEAVEILRNALQLKPTWRELHFNLGYACQELGREAEAIDYLRRALELDPGHVETYTALAGLLTRRGQVEEAGRLLEQARRLRE